MKSFAGIKNSCRFVMSKHARRGDRTRQILTGIFYTLLIYGFVTPCGALMRPQPLLGVGQRDMQNRFLFSANTNSFEMSKLEEKNLQGVKYSNPSASKLTKKQLIQELNKSQDNERIERDAKNKAYAYILSEGKFYGFADFCREFPDADWHAACLTGLIIELLDI